MSSTSSSTAPAFEIFGTTTSPFVRRVRVIAIEKGVPFTLVDVNAAEGQARLRSLTPVWKVPTVRFADGVVAWDSRVIIDSLCKDGWAPLRSPPTSTTERIDEENVVNAIDEATLSLVRLFYVKKDGGSVDHPFLQKEAARAESVLGWVSQRIREERYVGAFGAGTGFGRAELALFTSLQWIRFRKMAHIEKWPSLVAFENAWKDRPSLASTNPG